MSMNSKTYYFPLVYTFYVVTHGCVHAGDGENHYCSQLRDSLLIPKVMFDIIYVVHTSVFVYVYDVEDTTG